MFDPQFKKMFTHTVTIAPWDNTFDGNGAPNRGVAVSYQARVSGKKLSLRHRDSEESSDIFDVWFFAPATTRITTNDLLTLPNELVFSEDRTPVIFSVGRVADEGGQHHVKLQCGWMYHRQGQ